MNYYCILEVDFEGWSRPHRVSSRSYMELIEIYHSILADPVAPIAGPAFIHIRFAGLPQVSFKHVGEKSFWRCSRLTCDHLKRLAENEIGVEIAA